MPLCFLTFLEQLLCFFVPVEIKINTLQFIYLMVWWCHNCHIIMSQDFNCSNKSVA